MSTQTPTRTLLVRVAHGEIRCTPERAARTGLSISRALSLSHNFIYCKLSFPINVMCCSPKMRMCFECCSSQQRERERGKEWKGRQRSQTVSLAGIGLLLFFSGSLLWFSFKYTVGTTHTLCVRPTTYAQFNMMMHRIILLLFASSLPLSTKTNCTLRTLAHWREFECVSNFFQSLSASLCQSLLVSLLVSAVLGKPFDGL